MCWLTSISTANPSGYAHAEVGSQTEIHTSLVPFCFPKFVSGKSRVSEDALRQGRVDAVNMNQPFAAKAEAKGGTRKLFSLSEAMPNIVHIMEACRADFVDKNPELVKAYVADQGADPGARRLSAEGQ
jgi:hypothetical protein